MIIWKWNVFLIFLNYCTITYKYIQILRLFLERSLAQGARSPCHPLLHLTMIWNILKIKGLGTREFWSIGLQCNILAMLGCCSSYEVHYFWIDNFNCFVLNSDVFHAFLSSIDLRWLESCSYSTSGGSPVSAWSEIWVCLEFLHCIMNYYFIIYNIKVSFLNLEI